MREAIRKDFESLNDTADFEKLYKKKGLKKKWNLLKSEFLKLSGSLEKDKQEIQKRLDTLRLSYTKEHQDQYKNIESNFYGLKSNTIDRVFNENFKKAENSLRMKHMSPLKFSCLTLDKIKYYEGEAFILNSKTSESLILSSTVATFVTACIHHKDACDIAKKFNHTEILNSILNISMMYLVERTLPYKMIYIQYGKRSEPRHLWPSVKWADVTNQIMQANGFELMSDFEPTPENMLTFWMKVVK